MTDLFGAPTPPSSKEEREPPTDSDRLRMFISLATDHESLAEALPITDTVTMAEPVTTADRIDHMRRQLRAASTRKFIFDLRDHVHLEKVFASAEACVSGTTPPMNDYIQMLRERLVRVRTQSDVEYVLDGHDSVDDQNIIEDLVYGRLLHGDYAKWWRTEQRKRTGWEVSSLMFWLSDAESLIASARDMVVDGVNGGHLTLR